MSISAYLVDWDQFLSEFRQRYAEDHTFLYRALERDEPWVEPAGVFRTDSPTTAFIASEAYDEVRVRLKAADRKSCDKLLGALFWHIKTRHGYTPAWVHDLGAKADEEIFCITMKPATVSKYVKLVSPESLRVLHDGFDSFWNEAKQEYGRTHYSDRIKDAKEFLAYVSMWVELLKKATKQKKGVVVSWHGT